MTTRNLGDAPTWIVADLEKAAELAMNELFYRLHEYESALRFYARHVNWMATTEDPEALRRVLVAMSGDGEQHGWRVAENILKKHTALD